MLSTLALTMLFFKKQDRPVPPDIQAIKSWHEFKMKDIDGKEHAMSEYKGKTVLVVNVASKCGNTPQYAALESLYEKYKSGGLVVVGFPCNDFMGQEPGSDEQIKEFCTSTYNVKFPMYSKIHVKGPLQTPMYQWLVWKTGGNDIEWNFGKILLDKDGQVIARFNPKVKPDSEEVVSAVEKAVAAQN